MRIGTQIAPLSRDPKLDAIARLVVDKHRVAPCAAVGGAVRGPQGWVLRAGAYGTLLPSSAHAASVDTLFDLASLTKPFVAALTARLQRTGAISLRSPLGLSLDVARETPSGAMPLELLLSHRAGLRDHLPLYAPLTRDETINRNAALREAASARRAECPGSPPAEGFAPVYSDLGYLLVGEALTRGTKTPLDELLQREVNRWTGSCARPASNYTNTEKERIAPTEFVPWRGGLVRGLVHDENAWALAGSGLCGHAGLFGTAEDLLRFGISLVDALHGLRTEWLCPHELYPLVRSRPGSTLRAGFDGRSALGSSSGKHFGPNTLGHLGFTGTSLWVDPDRALVGALLTNRVCPTRSHHAIHAARPEAYDAIFAWAFSREAA